MEQAFLVVTVMPWCEAVAVGRPLVIEAYLLVVAFSFSYGFVFRSWEEVLQFFVYVNRTVILSAILPVECCVGYPFLRVLNLAVAYFAFVSRELGVVVVILVSCYGSFLEPMIAAALVVFSEMAALEVIQCFMLVFIFVAGAIFIFADSDLCREEWIFEFYCLGCFEWVPPCEVFLP